MNSTSPTDAQARAPRVYRDLNLRLASYNETDGTFRVWVEGEAPGGAMRPDDAVIRTYTPTDFWDDPAQGMGGLIGRLEARRRLTREDLAKLGALLADLALPEGRVRDLFNRSRAALAAGEGLRLRLRIDAVALAQLPWEYLALPKAAGEVQATDFLALQGDISIVRTDTVEAAARRLPQRPLARVVAAFSSPDDQTPPLEVDRDKAAIQKAATALNERSGAAVIETAWVEAPATLEKLIGTLREAGADIFHFSGHALFEPISRQGSLILERADYKSETFSGEKLAELLGSAGVRLVILGGCETARRDGQNLWTGIAAALTRENIPAVIGNQFRIQDENAIRLAEVMYPRLLSGTTVDEALFQARQAIYLGTSLENRDWGTPVLYLHDQTGVLFPLPQPESEEAQQNPFYTRVAIRLRDIAGRVTGFRADRAENITGPVDVTIEGGDVQAGGQVTGVEIGGI